MKSMKSENDLTTSQTSHASFRSCGLKNIVHTQSLETSSRRKKIGYIKINSVNGQVTFSVFENAGGLIFKKPNIHLDRIKPSNIIHLNVDNELFIEYSPQIKQHIDMLIRMYLDLSITDFTLAMHKLKESVKKKSQLKHSFRI